MYSDGVCSIRISEVLLYMYIGYIIILRLSMVTCAWQLGTRRRKPHVLPGWVRVHRMAFISFIWRDSSDSLESVWSSLSLRVCKPPQLSVSFLSFCSSVTMFCVHVHVTRAHCVKVKSCVLIVLWMYGNNYLILSKC